MVGKLHNKRYLQKKLGLIENDQAPLFFWPSRMDTIQKGCPLMAEILYHTIHSFWADNLERVGIKGDGNTGSFVLVGPTHDLAE